jgi:hypothetical protein
MRLHEFRRGQHVQVKRKRWAGQSEAARDCACRKPVRRVPDQQAKNVEPGLLRQSSQRIDSEGCLHISRTMEIYDNPTRKSNAQGANAFVARCVRSTRNLTKWATSRMGPAIISPIQGIGDETKNALV